jgi:hypothetical protein
MGAAELIHFDDVMVRNALGRRTLLGVRQGQRRSVGRLALAGC